EEALGVDQRRIGDEPARLVGFLEATQPLPGWVEADVPGEQSDPSMPEIEQMFSGEPCAVGVIGHHRIGPLRLVAVDDYDGNIEAAQEIFDLARDRRVWAYHEPIGPASRESTQQFEFTLPAAFRVGDQQGITRLVQHVVGGTYKTRELRNVDLADHAA